MSDFGTNTLRVSRKDRRCEWCGEGIPAEEKHQHYVGKFEGEFQDWRMHVECWDNYQTNCDPDGFSPYGQERPKLAVKP